METTPIKNRNYWLFRAIALGYQGVGWTLVNGSILVSIKMETIWKVLWLDWE